MRASLTLILLTWKIWGAPNNTTIWQMGFNSVFEGLSNVLQRSSWPKVKLFGSVDVALNHTLFFV